MADLTQRVEIPLEQVMELYAGVIHESWIYMDDPETWRAIVNQVPLGGTVLVCCKQLDITIPATVIDFYEMDSIIQVVA